MVPWTNMVSGCILEIETTGFTDGLLVGGYRKERHEE